MSVEGLYGGPQTGTGGKLAVGAPLFCAPVTVAPPPTDTVPLAVASPLTAVLVPPTLTSPSLRTEVLPSVAAEYAPLRESKPSTSAPPPTFTLRLPNTALGKIGFPATSAVTIRSALPTWPRDTR